MITGGKPIYVRIVSEQVMKIAFDVDGTLFTAGEPPYPDYIIINLLNKLHFAGHYIIVWSGGGKEYAEQRVRDLNIENIVDQCMSKLQNPGDIDLAFDDQEVKLAKMNVKL